MLQSSSLQTHLYCGFTAPFLAEVNTTEILPGLNMARGGKSTRLRQPIDFFGRPSKFHGSRPFGNGFNVEMLERDRRVALTVWDVGGQYTMRQHWPYYFPDTDGLVFVVDSADKRRMEDSRKEFERTLKHECLKGIPVVVMANKQDLSTALSAEEITKRFQLKRCCSDRDWYVQPCCAKTGEGLSEAIKVIISHVKKKMNSKDEGSRTDIQ
uniref:ADP-ribosylation factor-like protein 14 isoform X2 n=1 Tax=Pristiophorus japonicus TaxID=55135 RepID=UPI00398EA3E1